MNRHALAAALVAGLVLLAGCSSGLTGSPDGTATEESALDGETTAEEIDGETGTVNMYISDEQNAIDDFEHLNVTITRVGVKPAGDDGGGDAEESDDGDADDSDTEGDGNETTTETNTTESAETDTETPDADDADDEDDDAGAEDAADAEGESGWVEYEVDNRTVDLTELTGANATRLSSLTVPNGSYETVFVYVSEVNGTLKDGSDQRVKLPSGKLQLNSGFTVGDGEEVDFVFDITAIKAGNSGKYILKPVVSESGTDVEIDDVDADDEADGDRDSELNATFDGDVVAGENVTLSVTRNGEPVEGATVSVDGERVGETDADGVSAIQVPDDAEELDVTVTHEGVEAELEVELGDDGEATDDGADSENGNASVDSPQQRLTAG